MSNDDFVAYKKKSDQQNAISRKRVATKNAMRKALHLKSKNLKDTYARKTDKSAERDAKEKEIKKITGKDSKDLSDAEKDMVEKRLELRKSFIKNSKEKFKKLVKNKT